MKYILIILSMALLCMNGGANSASIYRAETGTEGVYEIHIDGEILPSDTDNFIRIFFQEPRGSYVRVALNSEGGDVAESLQIAKIIKDLMLGTKVKPKSICGSACFFIWSAGWTRNAGHTYLVNFYGKVGLHRPYLKNPSTDNNSIRYQTTLQNQIKKYLSDNLIPTRLVDAMMARPSNDVYWLTQQDLNELGKHPAPLEELFINKCQYDRRNYDLLSDLQIAKRTVEAEHLEKKIDSIYDCILDVRSEIKSKNMREFILKNESKYSKQNSEISANNDDAVEMALVNGVHPGWQKTVATRQFAAWLKRQPIEIKQLADSVRALDAIKLLDLYKVDINSTTKGKR